jgi:heme exporter protein D
MAFDNLAEFFAMGKHGVYVWSAYSFSVLALLLLIWHTLSRRCKARATLRKRFLRNEAR